MTGEKSALHYILKYIKIYITTNVTLNYSNMSQNICFYCVLYQINAALGEIEMYIKRQIILIHYISVLILFEAIVIFFNAVILIWKVRWAVFKSGTDIWYSEDQNTALKYAFISEDWKKNSKTVIIIILLTNLLLNKASPNIISSKNIRLKKS